MAAAALPSTGLVRKIAPLTAGHTAVDFTQTALPVLLPLFHDKFNLAYWQDALLYAGATFSNSVVQPLFGLVADRRERRHLLPLAVLVSGIALAAAAYAPSYPIAVLLAVISGLGVAAYHPEASRAAAAIAGDRAATGMSYFAVGGTAGFVLGPLLAGPLTAAAGLDAGWVLAVPALVASGLLFAASARLHHEAGHGAAVVRGGRDDVKNLVKLLFGLCLRGYVNFATLVFVVLFEEDGRHRSHGYAITVFGLMLAAGVVATLLAGPVADRRGPRTTMLAMSIPVPFLIVVYALDGSAVGALCVILAGGLVIGTFGISTVLAQSYLPSRVALASGLAIGFSIGVGGLLSLVMGKVADVWSFEAAFLSAAFVSVLAVATLFLLPPDRKRRRDT